MNLRPIFKDNAYEYSDFIDPDVAENLGRRFFRGLAAHDPGDDHILSLLIWELKAVEDLRDTESEIKWIYSDDASSIISRFFHPRHSSDLSSFSALQPSDLSGMISFPALPRDFRRAYHI